VGQKNLDRAALAVFEDWHGNNAAVRCPVCGKVFVVSGFLNKGERKCPRCERSTARITKDDCTLRWPDSLDEPTILTYKQLEDSGRLDEFVRLIEEGGAIDERSLQTKLDAAEKIAIIERDRRVVAGAALKRPRPDYAAHLSVKSEYELAGDMPELGYVAVACEWRGFHLSTNVVTKILAELGRREVFATTSEPKMKSLLERHGFKSVGREWPSKRGERLSLWIRERAL
jgi:N-acetylglutamate synthase-like GNAT family acetyltransferase/phage FluMu protein Com